jgi:hypothetical protein
VLKPPPRVLWRIFKWRAGSDGNFQQKKKKKIKGKGKKVGPKLLDCWRLPPSKCKSIRPEGAARTFPGFGPGNCRLHILRISVTWGTRVLNPIIIEHKVNIMMIVNLRRLREVGGIAGTLHIKIRFQHLLVGVRGIFWMCKVCARHDLFTPYGRKEPFSHYFMKYLGHPPPQSIYGGLVSLLLTSKGWERHLFGYVF